jgi:hypothetical protein
MAVTRTENTYSDTIDLSPGEDLSYVLTVKKAAHPTWTFGCEHRPYLASDSGKPKNEYRWTLRYEALDTPSNDEETYTVSIGFLGECEYQLVVEKQVPGGAATTIQDIEYSNPSGTDYYFETLLVQKN